MLRDLRYEHHFLFTQYSLNTFSNCPLKFKKRYLENLKWDTFPDESTKNRVEMGNHFHLLANRYFLGMDCGIHEETKEFSVLAPWFLELKKAFPLEKDITYLPEYKIRMNVPGLKLESNYDLLIVREGQVEIWDWKTHEKDAAGKIKNKEKKLKESLQTIVYLFVLGEQSSKVLKRNIPLENIKMCYWQPESPHLIAELQYNEAMHEVFRERLSKSIKEVLEYDFQHFEPALYAKHCKVCEFNWFCNNDKVDFDAMKEEDSFLDELSWDDIEEKF